jgi:serine/threonine protein kinase
MNTACPSSDSLRQYALGDVDDALADQIETHLADCPNCEETIASFDSADDTLVRHLPLAAGKGEDASGTPGWLDRLRIGPPAGQAAPGPHVVADGADLPHDQFSAYELVDILGRGGMGVVYRARHRQLNRSVALKVLSPRSTAAPEARRRFEREIQALGGLHHPGIVMATDAGRVNEAAYLVMELVDGVDLARLVRQGGPFTIAETCEVGRQMAEALAAAHEVGTIHRDVKPSNVMIDRRGRVKLLDFGLAHLHELSTESLETSLGRLLGTLDYMAPEQAAGDSTPGAGADLYGLGATLFFLLTGRSPRGPREGRSLVQQLRVIVDAEAPRVGTLRADAPPELDDFVARLLSRDPADRPPSAEAVADQLKQWAGGDLAARVIESKTNHAPDETASENSELVLQSLSELVGPHIARPSRSESTMNAANAPPQPAETAGLFGGGRRRWAWAAAAAGAMAAAFYGIVIILQTPKGTLRIESQFDDVEVSVVGENNKAQDMKIDREGDVTTLAAGRYRVRFNGKHDGMEMDHDVVTLKRGQVAVVKITQAKPGHVAALPEKYVLGSTERDWQNFLRAHRGLADIDQSCINCHREGPLPAAKTIDLPKTADSAPGERTYNGKSESEWQEIFRRDASNLGPGRFASEAVAKIEAAGALVMIAARRPAKAQIDQILNAGEELFRKTSGALPISTYFEDETELESDVQPGRRVRRGNSTGRPRGFSSRGSTTSSDESSPLQKVRAQAQVFRSQISEIAHTLPAELLATELCKAAVGESEPRAFFANWMLREPAESTISASPEGSSIVLRELAAPLLGRDRAEQLLLTRAQFLSVAEGEQRRELIESLSKLATRLTTDSTRGGPGSIDHRFLSIAGKQSDWPVELRQASARLIWSGIDNPPQRGSTSQYLSLNEADTNATMTPPYEATYIAAQRKKFAYFMDQWLPLVNRSLQGRSFDIWNLAGKVNALDPILLLHSDGDEWPVDKTATNLTELLGKYYAGGDNGPGMLEYQTFPAESLTRIVRITGQIPDVAHKSKPREPASYKLKDFESFLAGEREKFSSDPLNYFAGLYDAAPLEVIKLSVSETKTAPIQGRRVVYAEPLTPRLILSLASTGAGSQLRDGTGRGSDSFVDPLLLLAGLAELAGASEAQDARIATLVAEETTDWPTPTVESLEQRKRQLGLKGHLKNLLSGKLQAREHARRMLKEMAAKAKSPALVDAVKAIQDNKLSEAKESK